MGDGALDAGTGLVGLAPLGGILFGLHPCPGDMDRFGMDLQDPAERETPVVHWARIGQGQRFARGKATRSRPFFFGGMERTRWVRCSPKSADAYCPTTTPTDFACRFDRPTSRARVCPVPGVVGVPGGGGRGADSW